MMEMEKYKMLLCQAVTDHEHPAPVDSADLARHVREDTAELASYALTERSPSIYSSSPRTNIHSQPSIESYFAEDEDEEDEDNSLTPLAEQPGVRRDVIPELPEPTPPIARSLSYKKPGASALTDLIRNSPPNTSPPIEQVDEEEGTTEDDDGWSEHSHGSMQARLLITPDGLKVDSTEHTPLLLRSKSSEEHHPNYIEGENDLEGQLIRRRTSWPKLEKLVSKQLKKGRHALKIVTNPKKWDGRAIWRTTVVNPSAHLPAVVLGALLNILDALSYGKEQLSIPLASWLLINV
jgi:SulP family sulfate permease